MAISPQRGETKALSKGLALLERVRKGTDQWRVMPWPNAEECVAIRPLRCDELQESYGAAFERFAQLKLEVNVYTSDDFHAELALQMLARSLHDSEAHQPLFSSVEELRGAIVASDRDALVSAYVDHAHGADPDPDELTEEQFNQIESLVKKKDGPALSAISSRILASYLIGTENPSPS